MNRLGIGSKRWFAALWLAPLALQLAASCASRESVATDGPVTKSQADRYIRKAIRSSNEGVILLPSKKAERVYEAQRLNEIAQNLRRPAAVCFINRAIETMRRSDVDGELVFEGVPEGQIKIRTRISADGNVLRAEVLESGFKDAAIEPCFLAAIEKQRWPQNKSGHTHFIDVVYWVSLGAQSGLSEELALHVRKAQTVAGVKARQCVEGLVDAGSYRVTGLNLVDREGKTIVNRVDPVNLPEQSSACIRTALSDVGLPQDSGAFVRPVIVEVRFEVDRDGTVRVHDADWLTLIEREERAQRLAERAKLAEGDAPESDAPEPAEGAAAGDPGATKAPPAPEPRPPRGDPGKGGKKLSLGTRGDG